MRISMNEIWRNLDGSPKNKELWSFVVKFEFSRPKSSSYNSGEQTLDFYPRLADVVNQLAHVPFGAVEILF